MQGGMCRVATWVSQPPLPKLCRVAASRCRDTAGMIARVVPWLLLPRSRRVGSSRCRDMACASPKAYAESSGYLQGGMCRVAPWVSQPPLPQLCLVAASRCRDTAGMIARVVPWLQLPRSRRVGSSRCRDMAAASPKAYTECSGYMHGG